MRLIFLGPPGAGKGTQADILSKSFAIAHISTGDLLREAVKSGSQLGIKAKGYMNKGELVPDELVIDLVKERLKNPNTKKGFILDGFPRTKNQAQKLDEALGSADTIEQVIYFSTTKSVILERLTGRRLCKNCQAIYHMKNKPPKRPGLCDICGGQLYQRDDDKECTILKRIDVYNAQTKELIDYYSKKSLLREVSGDLEANKLFDILTALFGQYNPA